MKKYWKISERLMVKEADLVICDSKNIEKYIKEEYIQYNPNTTFIAYGADIEKSTILDNDKIIEDWYREKKIEAGKYYLTVGRFVPENNFKTIISEYMKSKTKKDLVLITNVEKNSFYEKLREETHFEKDNRIKFVGTVYDKELLKKIRENAFAYIHGHSVGGTNPSLIEALAATNLNLLYDIGFNKEVAQNGALYWTLEDGSLSNLIKTSEAFSDEDKEKFGNIAKKRVRKEYSWDYICNLYFNIWNWSDKK